MLLRYTFHCTLLIHAVAVQPSSVSLPQYYFPQTTGKGSEELLIPAGHNVCCYVQERAKEDWKMYMGGTEHQW